MDEAVDFILSRLRDPGIKSGSVEYLGQVT
jgi:hypothetical protein